MKTRWGGYREGSGRSKCGHYKGIYCGSTYELAWVVYNLDHKIPFERNNKGFRYSFEGRTRKYYPDFRLPDNSYVEIKGFKTIQDEAKWKKFPHKLQVLTKDELAFIFEYVKKTYGNRIEELYDVSRKNNSCRVCGESCYKVYCSRSCAMTGNRKQYPIKVTKTELAARARQYYNQNKNEISARRRELYKLATIE